ncbi:uncharacterized [Tachysurus ichikawai]
MSQTTGQFETEIKDPFKERLGHGVTGEVAAYEAEKRKKTRSSARVRGMSVDVSRLRCGHIGSTPPTRSAR